MAWAATDSARAPCAKAPGVTHQRRKTATRKALPTTPRQVRSFGELRRPLWSAWEAACRWQRRRRRPATYGPWQRNLSVGFWSCLWPTSTFLAICDGPTLVYLAISARGRGYGLVATRRISAGELIIAECPLFIVHGTEAIRQQVAREHEDLSGLDTATMRKANAAAALDARFSLAVAAALGAAGATEVAAFCELSDSFFEDGSSECDEKDDALHIRSGSWVQLTSAANGAPCGLSGVALRSEVDGKRVTWQVQVHDQVWSLPGEALRCLTVGSVGGAFLTNAVSTSGQDVACVYGLSSRINHSCRPNALVLEREGMRCIFAASAIEQGDEVCISYVEDFTSQRHSAMREKVHALARTLALDAELMLVALFRQQLFVKWGFWCTCQRCAAVAPAADLALALWCEL